MGRIKISKLKFVAFTKVLTSTCAGQNDLSNFTCHLEFFVLLSLWFEFAVLFS